VRKQLFLSGLIICSAGKVRTIILSRFENELKRGSDRVSHDFPREKDAKYGCIKSVDRGQVDFERKGLSAAGGLKERTEKISVGVELSGIRSVIRVFVPRQAGV
jgi:hypothetical protein